jgi:hypothetical protein
MYAEFKRDILYFIYKMMTIEIDFKNKCEYCFNTWTWQTKEGKFVCERHNNKKE